MDHSSTNPQFLSPAKFAAVCGCSLSTIHRLLKRGQLPKYQPGGKGSLVLIPIDALSQLSAKDIESSSDRSDASERSADRDEPVIRRSRPRWRK